MQKIRTAMLGTGFMGIVHTEAIRRLGNVEVTAVAGSSDSKAKAFADQLFIEKSTGDWESLLKDPNIDAVHICTPNALHHPMAKIAIENGKHVLCEKPLTMTSAEAQDLLTLAEAKGVAHATNHNLRYYPAVQQIRQMVAAGDLGEILAVQGTYSQDWLLYDTDYNWRIEAEHNGKLRAMGDIGSHWMDMIQHLTALPITSVCGELTTFHKTRKKPKGSYGTKSGVAWNQEKPDELWIGHRNSPNQVIVKDGSLFYPAAAAYAELPGGHSEGYDDSHKNLFKRFYRRVADPKAAIDYPTFADGLRGMLLLEAVAASSERRGWVDVSL
ncbi:MAG: Gfo/Idh/MocA family oxidoreductase [Acidobacteria bacterium]|nr:Gfo/Idh/MocA family oxidoreductase [Acidobacteriota bacterium]